MISLYNDIKLLLMTSVYYSVLVLTMTDKKKSSNGKIKIRNLMYDAGNLKQVLCNNIEGWEGKWKGVSGGRAHI